MKKKKGKQTRDVFPKWTDLMSRLSYVLLDLTIRQDVYSMVVLELGSAARLRPKGLTLNSALQFPIAGS